MKEDWIEVELGKVCSINMGQSPPSATYNKDGDGMPFFQGKAEFTELHPVVKKWCTAPKKTAKKGDVLISVRAPVGSTNIANIDCAIGRGLAAITYRFGYKYIWYFLRQIERRLDDQGTGTTFKAISGSILKSQKIPLAPLPEQRAIVAKIEQLFSELDNGIANLKAAKDKLEIYRQAVLKKAFEGELTKEWRDGLNHDSKDSDDNLDSISRNQGSDNEILPEGWKLVIVKEIAEKIQYGYTESSSMEQIGPKFLRITDIQNNKVDWKTVPYCKIEESEIEKYQLRDGDIVFARTGATVGKSFLIKGNIPNSVYASYLIRMRFPNTIFDKYIWNFFQSSLYWIQIKKKSVGTGQPNVNGKKLGEIEIPLCSHKEQAQIVHEIETRLSICDNILANIEEGLNKSEALRQSILKQAFEGKLLSEEELEACRAAPDWEPAEQLLERIKNQKEGTA